MVPFIDQPYWFQSKQCDARHPPRMGGWNEKGAQFMDDSISFGFTVCTLETIDHKISRVFTQQGSHVALGRRRIPIDQKRSRSDWLLNDFSLVGCMLTRGSPQKNQLLALEHIPSTKVFNTHYRQLRIGMILFSLIQHLLTCIFQNFICVFTLGCLWINNNEAP